MDDVWPVCKGAWWVCENHPDRAWRSQCQCGKNLACPACDGERASFAQVDPLKNSLLSAAAILAISFAPWLFAILFFTLDYFFEVST